MRVVGVVGAGVMGVGVAQSAAQAGLEVVLVDLTEDKLARALTHIRNSLRFHGLMGGPTPATDIPQILGRIRGARALSELGAADFVIENVPERLALKEAVYADLDRHCPPHCVFAANTSGIPITKLASASGRPTQFIGMHFMNPVPLKRTVELIRGFHTSEQTVQLACELLQRMGKGWISVADAPGFVSNRVLMLSINEAINVVHEGIAGPGEVDRIFMECLNHKMGPLETADLIGLDTILLSIEALHEQFGESKFRPSMLLRKMVDAGLYGRKGGRGFYDYSRGASQAPHGARTQGCAGPLPERTT